MASIRDLPPSPAFSGPFIRRRSVVCSGHAKTAEFFPRFSRRFLFSFKRLDFSLPKLARTLNRPASERQWLRLKRASSSTCSISGTTHHKGRRPRWLTPRRAPYRVRRRVRFAGRLGEGRRVSAPRPNSAVAFAPWNARGPVQGIMASRSLLTGSLVMRPS